MYHADLFRESKHDDASSVQVVRMIAYTPIAPLDKPLYVTAEVVFFKDRLRVVEDDVAFSEDALWQRSEKRSHQKLGASAYLNPMLAENLCNGRLLWLLLGSHARHWGRRGHVGVCGRTTK